MYARLLNNLAIFILVFSCQDNIKDQDSSFYRNTNKRWQFAKLVSWISPHYEADTPIKKPANTWQPILKIDFLDVNFNIVSDCIFYFIPDDKNKGILKVVANPTGVTCHDLLGEVGYAEFTDIYNFGFEYNDNLESEDNLILKIDTIRLKYNFLNLSKNEPEKKLLSNGSVNSKIKGVALASNVDYGFRPAKLKDSEICFDITDDCQIVKTDQCSLCLNGSYSIVASACSNRFRRVCGINYCGKQNQPACFRGFKTSGIELQNYCVNDSPAGLCEKGLRVVCINKVLMCE